MSKKDEADKRIKEAFKNHVCSICKICNKEQREVNPAFCMVLYGSDKDRFLKMIKYALLLEAVGKEGFIVNFSRFSGFCGLFCNSNPTCPFKGKACQDLQTRIDCYNHFSDQTNRYVSPRLKAQLYENYSGIEMDVVGEKFRLPSDKVLKRMVHKKARKKINKRINDIAKLLQKAISGENLKSESKYVSVVKKVVKKKRIKTTVFFNDNDAEWESKINSILEGTYERSATNDRQLNNSKRHFGGA